MLALRAHVVPTLVPLLLFAGLTALAASRSGSHLRAAVLCQLGNPAPVLGHFDADAPGYLVGFRAGVAEAERLEDLYGFSAGSIWTTTPGFYARLDTDVREMLRCEPSVQYIEYNAVVRVD